MIVAMLVDSVAPLSIVRSTALVEWVPGWEGQDSVFAFWWYLVPYRWVFFREGPVSAHIFLRLVHMTGQGRNVASVVQAALMFFKFEMRCVVAPCFLVATTCCVDRLVFF